MDGKHKKNRGKHVLSGGEPRMELELNLRITKPARDPPFESVETATAFILLIYLSDVEKDEIRIDINEERTIISISIRGRRTFRENVVSGRVTLQRQLEIGRFEKAFWIPDEVEVDLISASYNEVQGIVYIYMPKAIRGFCLENENEVQQEEEKENGTKIEQEEEETGVEDQEEDMEKEEEMGIEKTEHDEEKETGSNEVQQENTESSIDKGDPPESKSESSDGYRDEELRYEDVNWDWDHEEEKPPNEIEDDDESQSNKNREKHISEPEASFPDQVSSTGDSEKETAGHKNGFLDERQKDKGNLPEGIQNEENNVNDSEEAPESKKQLNGDREKKGITMDKYKDDEATEQNEPPQKETPGITSKKDDEEQTQEQEESPPEEHLANEEISSNRDHQHDSPNFDNPVEDSMNSEENEESTGSQECLPDENRNDGIISDNGCENKDEPEAEKCLPEQNWHEECMGNDHDEELPKQDYLPVEEQQKEDNNLNSRHIDDNPEPSEYLLDRHRNNESDSDMNHKDESPEQDIPKVPNTSEHREQDESQGPDNTQAERIELEKQKGSESSNEQGTEQQQEEKPKPDHEQERSPNSDIVPGSQAKGNNALEVQNEFTSLNQDQERNTEPPHKNKMSESGPVEESPTGKKKEEFSLPELKSSMPISAVTDAPDTPGAPTPPRKDPEGAVQESPNITAGEDREEVDTDGISDTESAKTSGEKGLRGMARARNGRRVSPPSSPFPLSSAAILAGAAVILSFMVLALHMLKGKKQQ